MTIYLFNVLYVCLCAVVAAHCSKKTDSSNKPVFLIGFFTLIFLEMALRGNFTTDMQAYEILYNTDAYGTLSSFKNVAFWEIGAEPFYAALNIIVKGLFNSYRFLVIILAFIIAYSYTLFLRKYSYNIWLSFLVLLCSGSYYAGFNITRQILAAALFALTFRFLLKKQIVPYIVAVVLISGFHKSALIMIPMYFILTFSYKRFNKKSIIIIVVLISVLVYLFSPLIITWFAKFFYSAYSNENAYGMNIGTPILSTFKALVLAGIVLVKIDEFDFNKHYDTTVFNGVVLYLFFSIAGARVFMIQRFANYFIPFLMLAFPMIGLNKQKQLSNIALAIILILSNINYLLHGTYEFFF